MRFRLVLYLTASCLTLASIASVAEDVDDTNSQIEQINSQVQEQAASLQELDQQASGIESELKKIQEVLTGLKAEEKRAQDELNKLKSEMGRIDLEINRAREEAVALTRLSNSRIRALYMTKSRSFAEGVLNVGNSGLFAENAYYLSKVTRFDRMLLERIYMARKQQEERRGELGGLVSQQKLVVQKVSVRRKAVQAKSDERDRVAAKLKEQRKAIESAMASLRAQALRLETVMTGLTGGPDSDRKEKVADKEKVHGDKVSNQAFVGRGLFRQKGSLVAPVTGKVLQGFGRHKLRDFSDFVVSKGLEFSAAAGSSVKAIAQGRVVFSGRMPSYGPVVILDHGERYYSLYGRLDSVKVELGDVVQKGETIASLPEPDERKRNFYFEIRQNGNSVNPQQFFGGRL